MKSLFFAASSLAALALVGAGAPGHAATAADTTASSGTGLSEVVVTARRREESAERVPTTIVALSRQTLIEHGIHTETDLQLAVPGLIVRTFDTANTLTFSIRGESLDSYSGSAPGVQPYINEIPITATTPSAIFDMQNIQVLKGPQGTLFGRNSTGGAVLYTTTQPGNEYGGYASVQYGNLDKLITEAAVDLPIVKDRVLLRLAATYQQGGAFIHNLYDQRNYGDKNGGSYRATLTLKPVDNLTNTTTVQLTNLYGTSDPGQVSYVVPCGQTNGSHTCLFEPGNPAFDALISPGQTLFTTEPYSPQTTNPNALHYVFPGGYAAYPAFIHGQGRYVVDFAGGFSYHSVADFVGNTTTFTISPDLLVKNSFGYQRTSLHSATDDSLSPYLLQLTGGNAPGGPNVERPVDTVVSDELQLQGKAFNNRLTYIVGGFFNDETDDFNSPITGEILQPYPYGGTPFVDSCVPTSPTNCATAPLNYAARYHQIYEDRSFAGFAQATYAITDKLNLTGGFRYTTDHLRSVQAPGSAFFNFTGHGEELQQTNENEPSWTVSLDYHVTPDWMVYVTQRGSWRTGGYEPAGEPLGNTITSAVGGNYFLPETIKDVEVGSKYSGRIGDVPVRFNIDYFNAWADNVQKIVAAVINGTISAATLDVPKANIMGVETDFEFRPASWLRFGGNGAWVDAEFITKETPFLGSPAFLGHFADTPRFSGALYADATWPLSGNYGTLNYHVDVYAQSGLHTSSISDAYTPGTELPPYAVVNMRLDWREPLGSKGLTASVFVKNIGDELYYTGGSPNAGNISAEGVNYAQPRTFGGILRYEF